MPTEPGGILTLGVFNLFKKSLEFMEWMADDIDKDSGQPEDA